MTPEEYRKSFRVLDRMLTGHSILRDRYSRRATAMTLAIVALSVAATAVAFAEAGPVKVAGLELEFQEWVGIFGALIFTLSLIDLYVDWRGVSRSHADAATKLAELKHRFRAVNVSAETLEAEGADIAEDYARTMLAIAKIPDRKFVSLKLRHERKVALSRLAEERPGLPLPLLRLVLVWRSVRRRGDPSETV